MCEIYSILVLSKLWFEGNKIVLLRQKRWSSAHWSQEFLAKKNKTSAFVKNPFSRLQTHLGTHVSLDSFEWSMKRPFSVIFFLRGKPKSPITNHAKGCRTLADFFVVELQIFCRVKVRWDISLPHTSRIFCRD